MELKHPILVANRIPRILIKDLTWKYCWLEAIGITIASFQIADYRAFRTYLGLLWFPYFTATIALNYKKSILKAFGEDDFEIQLPIFSKRNQKHMKVLVPLFGGELHETSSL